MIEALGGWNQACGCCEKPGGGRLKVEQTHWLSGGPTAAWTDGPPIERRTGYMKRFQPQLAAPLCEKGEGREAALNMLDDFYDLALLFHRMAREMTPQDIIRVMDTAWDRKQLLEEAAQKKKDGADVLQSYATDALAVSIGGASAALGGEKAAGLSQSLGSTSQAVSAIGQAKNQSDLAEGDRKTADAEYTRAQQDMSSAFFQSFSQTALSIRRSLSEMIQAELAARQAVARA